VFENLPEPIALSSASLCSCGLFENIFIAQTPNAHNALMKPHEKAM